MAEDAAAQWNDDQSVLKSASWDLMAPSFSTLTGGGVVVVSHHGLERWFSR